MKARFTARTKNNEMEMEAVPDAVPPVSDSMITGGGLVLAFRAGMNWLERNLSAVNALNVFPVPDGDTGTNMFLTMKAAYEAAAEGGDAPGRNAGEVAARAAYGALMGARGNSGVILSQIFRGIAKALDGHATLDAKLLATAFTEASAMAYKAVLKPVEGTLLTVSRGAAEAAEAAVKAGGDVRAVLDAGLNGARATLARTPELLPLLREAGVVDAGGQGFVIILEGMRLHFAGRNIETEDLPEIAPVAPQTTMEFNVGAVAAEHGEDDFGYCTNFLLTAPPGAPLNFTVLREHLAGMGHSAVIVGDEQYLKAHIHTIDPGACLSYALQFGSLTQMKIDNMDAQVETLEGHAAPSAPQQIAPVAVIAVAAGNGVSTVLKGQGAIVVRGGQTMNPSTQEILDAINAAPSAARVIVLPNNGNIILAARQAAEMAGKPASILPTRSVPQGIAALACFNVDADHDANIAAMTTAMERVRTGGVTRAVRNATIGGVAVQSGQVIGLVDDVLTVAGSDALAVTLDLLNRMEAGSAELITLYRGAEATESDADALKDRIEAAFPDAAVELLPGGQPHYDYVLSVE